MEEYEQEEEEPLTMSRMYTQEEQRYMTLSPSPCGEEDPPPMTIGYSHLEYEMAVDTPQRPKSAPHDL